MKMFFKTYVSWIYLYQNMDPLLAWGVHKGMIQWYKYLNLTKRKRKSKAEKKWQQGVEEGGDRPSRYPMHGTITWTTSTQCIGRRKEGCDKPSLKVQTTASTTDPILRPWCGVRYTIRWCSFTPLRMVVTLRNVKCKILGYFLVK